MKFAPKILLLQSSILLTVGLICWVGEWRTWSQYSTGLFAAGTLAILTGLIGHLTPSNTGGDFGSRYGASAGNQTDLDRTNQDLSGGVPGFRSRVVLLVSGTRTLLMSIAMTSR
jgi:hypothetical protein